MVSVLVANMFFTMRPGLWPFKISNFRVLAPLTLWMEVSTATYDDIDLQDLKRDSFRHRPDVISKPFCVFLNPQIILKRFRRHYSGATATSARLAQRGYSPVVSAGINSGSRRGQWRHEQLNGIADSCIYNVHMIYRYYLSLLYI